MAWACSGESNNALVNKLRQHGLFHSTRIQRAMESVDRAKYTLRTCPDPYADRPQTIGYQATISAPHMHAMCLELLEPYLQQGKTCLDVGSGSGYLTAIMARLVGPSGRAFGIEHIPQLVEFSEKNVKEDAPDIQNIEFIAGDGRQGLPEKAPFDCIHVGAAAPGFPEALARQLKIGGRMVVPMEVPGIGQQLMQIDRVDENHFERTKITGVMYVPLTDRFKQVSE